jgi:hypothetical protein
MTLLPPCLITGRIMTINPRTFPQRLIPSTVRRKATTERKARAGIRTTTGPIAEISIMGISTGPGSTASDGSQPLTRSMFSFLPV